MSSITDYIRWYADFTFYDKPFNEADNVVLCMLTYYGFDLKETSRPTSVRRAASGDRQDDPFLNAVCSSRRFGSLLISDFLEIFSRDTCIQFAAMKFHLYDNVYYIAFRGTDNSLVGWKEDFVMSYKITQAQESAVQYLEKVIKDDEEYLVGGHSKGGNLALYGACHVSAEKLRRIKHLYNNDGPGLCPEVSDVTLVEKVKDRMTVIYPQYCIFGKIFAHEIPDTRIVTSSSSGIMEHDLLTWNVEHGVLDYTDKFDPNSEWINGVAEKWIKDVKPSERESLVKSVFDTVESRGVETYTEALKIDVDKVEDLIKNVVESDSVKAVAKIPEKALFGDFIERLRTGKLAKFINANQLIEGITFTVIGVLMAIFSDKAFHIIITILLGAVVVFQFGYTIKKLAESHWNFVREKTRVYIFVVIATVFTIILVKQEAMFIVGSGLAGGWLLVVAYRSFLAFKQSKTRDFAFWKNVVKSILYTGCGVFIILAPSETVKWFMLALGVVMAIDGISAIIYSVIEANEKYSAKYQNLKEKVKHKK
ncbi:Mbeg1-like protein [Ruminococcus sp.]|uniref:Mbeg1-like protein n=1 Tax=Ruminococcus sp. TaxID=41978 RepID=UPI0038646A09